MPEKHGHSRKILILALPIIGGMVSQNVLNLVDTAMVGTLGSASLAAVGLASFANFLSQAFITGLGAGVQAMAARRLGEGKTSEMAVPLNGGLLLTLGLGLPITILLLLTAPLLFPYLNQDPEVIAIGIPYWQARLFGLIAVGSNFAFRGYWNGIHRPGLYLKTLLIMHACNIVLNWLLIFGHLGFPELGATGAGIGTTLATWIGTAYYFILGHLHAKEAGFLRGLPERATMKVMLRLSIPSGIQMLFFAAGFTTLFWIIGRVGTHELAAANVLVNITLVALLPGMGFGLAAASLVGQALGRDDPKEAKRWGWEVTQIGALLMAVLGLPMIFVPELMLALFIHEDPAPMELAKLPLQLVGATIALDGVGIILLNAMIGAGDTKRMMKVSIGLQWGIFLPIAYLIGPVLGYGLLAIWMCQIIYRILQALVLTLLWQSETWTKIKL